VSACGDLPVPWSTAFAGCADQVSHQRVYPAGMGYTEVPPGAGTPRPEQGTSLRKDTTSNGEAVGHVMELGELKAVYAHEGPFVTVYLEGRSPSEDAEKQVRLLSEWYLRVRKSQ